MAMTKKDILVILYSERNRLMSLYTRPGWTTWALVGAIASLLWLFLDLYIEDSFSWKYSVAIFYSLFNIFISVSCLVTAFKNNHQPLWAKGGSLLSIGIVIAFMVYLAQCVMFINHKALFAHIGILYYSTVVINILLLLLLIFVFIMSFIPSLRTQKNNRVAGCVTAVLFLLFVAEWGMVVLRDINQIEICNIKAGLIMFAIGVLVGCFNVSTRDKLNKLDDLINKVLYEEDEIDEKKILSELETCMIGLKYRDFLMNDNYDYISKWTRYLYWNLCILNEATINSNDYTDNIRSIVKDSLDRISHLQYRIDYVLKMVKLGYDEKDLDPKLSPLFRVMKDSCNLNSIWNDIWKKMSEYNFEDFRKFVNLKEQEANLIFKGNSTNNIVNPANKPQQ